MIVLRIGGWLCCCLFCLHRLAILRLCVTATKSLFNYHSYKCTNCWPSVDPDCVILSNQYQLPLIIVFIMIWTYWMPFWHIETQPCGKAKRGNIFALFALTRLKFIYLATRFIVPAIHLFINRYWQATAHYSPIIYLYLKHSVKQHKEAGKTLTHSVRHFLRSHIPPLVNCIDCQQHHSSMSLWVPCWPNPSGNIWHGTPIPLLWAFRILDAIVLLYIRFNIYLAIIFAVIWIIQVAIPVKPIFSIWNVFRCTILISFHKGTVESSDLVGIYYSSSSPREVLCRHSWLLQWSHWQFKCSRTFMVKEWPGWYDDPFSVWNVSYGCHLLVLIGWFLLRRM